MKSVLIQGLIGFTSSIGAVGITLTAVEQWIRVAGAFVGLIVGVLTIISMIRKLRRGE